MLHTHSFIYHPRCIMFFSQHFSFPCQYHSTNAPYSFIHLPPTLYNVFSPITSVFPCQYLSTNSPYSFIHFLERNISISNVNIIDRTNSVSVSCTPPNNSVNCVYFLFLFVKSSSLLLVSLLYVLTVVYYLRLCHIFFISTVFLAQIYKIYLIASS